MSAPDIEGLTDQIVEYTPGERDLAERIARGIWPLVVEAQERALVEAADAIGTPEEAIEIALGGIGYVEDFLRRRAEALKGDESHGGDSVPDRSTSAGDRRTGGLSHD